MEAAGVWKAPGRHPPTPGPSHTPWKSWAPAPRPPRIPTAPTAPATRSYILLGKTRKEAPRRPLEPNMSRRPSLRSDEWSPSSEQVVAFVGIRIDVPVKVERGDGNVRAAQGPLEERPEVLQPVRMDLAVDIALGV